MQKSYIVRRLISIILIAFLLVFLFWPSIIRLNGQSDAFDSYYHIYLKYGKANRDLFAEQFAAKEGMGLSHDDAYALGQSFFMVLLQEGASFQKVVSLTPDLLRYMNAPSGTVTFFRTALYILFYGIIALAAAAILMSLFGKSKVFHILLLVISILAGSFFMFMGMLGPGLVQAVANGEGASPVGVGLASILIPVFALAALILYRRPKKQTSAARDVPEYVRQKATSYPAPGCPQTPADERRSQPSVNPYPPVTGGTLTDSTFTPISPDEIPFGGDGASSRRNWRCPICGAENPDHITTCPHCGETRE